MPAAPSLADGRPPRTAAAVVDALSRQQEAKEKGKESRRHARRRWVMPLDVIIEERTATGSHPRGIQVTTQDLSPGGFSFVSRHMIHPGTQLRVRFDLLPNRPTLRCVVRHCAHAVGAEHLIGVAFI